MYKYFLIFLLLGCSKTGKIKEAKFTQFSELNSEYTGVTFNNLIEESLTNFFQAYNYAYNGGGVAVGDINNDGLPDIYFTGNQVQDKLYLNLGDFKFKDITSTSGFKYNSSWHNGVTMVDVNNDGLLDIYICKGGWVDKPTQRENLLYINQGDDTFKEQSKAYGLNDSGFSMMASFFDADNDNDLDMYLVNRPKDFFMPLSYYLDLKQKNKEEFSDKLYINNSGKFKEVSKTKGITDNFANGLGIVTSDIDNNGAIDIYVANDYFEHDYLYSNDGSGFFEQKIKEATKHVSFSSMGVDVADFNNDGLEDIVSLEMSPEDYVRSKTNMASMNVKQYETLIDKGFHNQYMHNSLQLNRGDNFFSEISQLAGIAKTDWSWACLAADFDNDGKNDIYVTNGFKRDIWNKDANKKYLEYSEKGLHKNKPKNQIIKEIVDFFPSNKLSNYMYRNQGSLQFENKSQQWGLGTPSFSNGAAYADFDNDGDLDLVVNNIDDEAFIYKNNTEKISKNNFLKIKLKGPIKNGNGLGAKVTLYHSDSIQYKDFKTVRGYLSSVEPMMHFGLEKLKKIDSIEVKWLDGSVNRLYEISANQILKIDYKESTKDKVIKLEKTPLLKEVSETAFNGGITHVENSYDDYKHQILLPHKLSTLGPALASGDFNNDGLEDFYVGGAKDFKGRLMVQTAGGMFNESNQKVFDVDIGYEDVAAQFLDVDGDKDLDLYVVSGGNEWERGSVYYQDRLYLNDKGKFVKSDQIPSITSSGSCVVSLDFDNDGDLDLFVGARHVPREYPKAPKSYLLENVKGNYIDATSKVASSFADLGMVTSAVKANIDNDNLEELIIVGEWMQVRVFKWVVNRYLEITGKVGLRDTYGWWNTVVADDVDADGDMDLIVGNLGLNYKFKASQEKPFYIYADDYDKNGTQDVFLAKGVKGKIVPIRGKECSTQQLPGLSKKFKTYNEFANADLLDIIGEDQSKSTKYKVSLFSSVILINTDGFFKINKLPVETQFSTVNGIVVDDFDGDNIKDILLGGNRFNVEVETTRSDASIGLLLQGNGKGDFRALSRKESGLFIPENVKNMLPLSLGIQNNKGILIGVNNGSVKLYSSDKYIKKDR